MENAAISDGKEDWKRIERLSCRRNKGNEKHKGCNTKSSQEVTHPITTLVEARLTAEF